MYIVTGTKFGGRSGEAPLRYDTLDEALQKVRDLIEADEIDEDGRMFASYVLSFDHPAAGDLSGRTALRHGVDTGETDAEAPRDHEAPDAHAPNGPFWPGGRSPLAWINDNKPTKAATE